MKKSELKEIIREVVKEELREHMMQVKKYIKTTVPVMVGESVGTYIDDKLEEVSIPSKKRPINESVDAEDWPMLDKKVFTSADRPRVADRSKLAAMLGYGDVSPSNTISTLVTDAGVEVPVNQTAIPDYLIKALNTNYSDYLKKLNAVTAASRAKDSR